MEKNWLIKISIFHVKKIILHVFFGEVQLTQILLNFKTSRDNLKIRAGSKSVCGFSKVLWVRLNYATTHHHPPPPTTTHH